MSVGRIVAFCAHLFVFEYVPLIMLFLSVFSCFLRLFLTVGPGFCSTSFARSISMSKYLGSEFAKCVL